MKSLAMKSAQAVLSAAGAILLAAVLGTFCATMTRSFLFGWNLIHPHP